MNDINNIQSAITSGKQHKLNTVHNVEGLKPLVHDATCEDSIQAPLTFVNDSSLRARLEAIQNMKNAMGIESSAAMPIDPFTAAVMAGGAMAAAKTAYELYKSWKSDKERDQAITEVNTAVTEAIELLGNEYWNNDLLSTAPNEVESGINKLIQGALKNPDKVTTKVEIALDKLLRSKYHSSDKENEDRNKRTARGLILSLLALYGRSDTRSNIRNSCDKLIKYLEDSSNYPLIKEEEASLESMRRILVANWKVPIEKYKIPDHQERSKDYRCKIYLTMLDLVKPGAGQLKRKDRLYLRTDPPPHLEAQVIKFREALVRAYSYESGLSDGPHSAKHHQPIVNTIGEILENSSKIPKELWSKTAQEELIKKENNEKRFLEFKKWSTNLHNVLKMNEAQLQACFNSLTTDQVRFLGYFPGDNKSRELELIFKVKEYESKKGLNLLFTELLEFMDLDTKSDSEKLSERNIEKALFFFRCLNHLMEKKVIVGGASPSECKNYLSEENKNAILRVCQRIVHDTENFPSTHRGYEFFTKPYLDSVPGQALALYHRLTRCFNNEKGYVDAHGLKDLVISNTAHNLYPTGEQSESFTSGFLLSGPPGTGKTFFAEALANQLAIPLFRLNPSMVVVKGENITVNFDNREISLGSFFDKVKANTPSVLLLDDIDELLKPREIDKLNKVEDEGGELEDEKDDSTQTGKFLPEIQNLRDGRGASKVILILTTNQPPTARINLTKLDDKGYSKDGYKALCEYVSRAAIRRKRVDYKVFTFHKLFNENQGEAFAKRFIDPYVESGKVTGPIDYVNAGKVVMKYTPATVESTFSSYINRASEPITQDQLLTELEKQPSMFEGRADYGLLKIIDSRLTILISEGDKKSEGEFDLDELAFRAIGLSKDQIKKALEDLTPDVLTQQNIIEAFEKVRSEV